MKKIKLNEYWIDTLKLIQTVDKSAIIAGGAIRDTYLNQHVNDVDIYTNESNIRSITEWRQILNLSPDDVIHNIQQRLTETTDNPFYANKAAAPLSEPSGDGCQYITQVLEVWKKNECPIQLISLNRITPIDYVSTYFDIGLCKTFCDGNRIHYSAEFTKDIRNNTLTLCGQMQTAERMWQTLNGHVKKLNDRYPERTLVMDLNKVMGTK